MLAKVEKERQSTGGLQLLQRLFVSEFLASQEGWGYVAGTTIPRGRELDWYLSTGALQWHIQGAWTRPLAEDALACSWLQHATQQAAAPAVLAIPPRDQKQLAENLARAGKIEQAMRVLCNLVELVAMPDTEIEAHGERMFEYAEGVAVEARSPAHVQYEAIMAGKMVSACTVFTSGWDFGVHRLEQV